MKNASAVIMAGGQGERYWPLTHKHFPKYRIRLDGERSLLRNTYERLCRLYPKERIHVVTTRDHRRMIREELPKLPVKNIFIEPERRNTAAAILFSCAKLLGRYGPGSVASFFPADHLICNEARFRRTLRSAVGLAQAKTLLVTIGIRPTFPAVGYGYIQTGPSIAGFAGAHRVARFTEKPVLRVAKRYVKRGDFYWNGGIFSWRLEVFLEAVRRFAPEYHAALDLGRPEQSYPRFPKLSIDYALLEKADNMAVLKTDMDWCDMGSWDMFFEKGRSAREANLLQGLARDKESRDSLILNYTDKPLVTLGLEGFIVVQTERGVLVCRRGRSEEAALLSRALSA